MPWADARAAGLMFVAFGHGLDDGIVDTPCSASQPLSAPLLVPRRSRGGEILAAARNNPQTDDWRPRGASSALEPNRTLAPCGTAIPAGEPHPSATSAPVCSAKESSDERHTARRSAIGSVVG